MKILFNCSVNVVGGAIQNSANFIKYAFADSQCECFFLVSHQVFSVLTAWGIAGNNIVLVDSPARSMHSRKVALDLERFFQPDIVYTMAGPTYINFKSPHVMGISDPYITHADFLSLRLNRSFVEALRFGVVEFLKGVHARLHADFFLFQTESSRFGFCKRYMLPKERTSLLQNAIGEAFLHSSVRKESVCWNQVKIFVPSAYYSHKNLEIIFELVSILSSRESINFEFVTTAQSDSNFVKCLEGFPLRSHICNVGPYSYANARELYESIDVVFIPSILETFSTSYLEAMAMAKPLVVADRDFSREVCGTYANYYSPLSAESAADALCKSISSVIDDAERERVLNNYGDQFQRFNRAMSILKDVVSKGGYV
ncbi:glycosyltransferase [Thalassolituus pacificus]|uniref:Glycosyltransferase n=1 Tax=Thalassolituus pacificus TaxID=2975440 RepID=A0A9X3AS52_9GAMM|nr:glycosyltransferase [Thalassolituus pacificus]MCT7358578.1 glycosyltransferase [Thalassolituus pacificus]